MPQAFLCGFALNARQLSLPEEMDRKYISPKYKQGFLVVDGLVTCGRTELPTLNYTA